MRRWFGAALAAMVMLPAAAIAALPAAMLQAENLEVRIFFDWDQTVPPSSADPLLDVIATRAGEAPYKRIEIAGNTDTAVPANARAALSTKMAQSVADALVARGLDRKRMTVAGRGSSAPLMAEGEGVRSPLNRRVDVTIVR